jgi:hypothetical protein
MNSLRYLKAILKTLKPEEINSLEKFISYQTDREDQLRSKSSVLLKLMLGPEDYTANEMQRTLYGKLNYPAFNKLVNRLKEKTLEVILFNANLQRGHYSERSRMVFELRKKLMQIDLLILKGLRVKILDEINLVIKKAKEFEIYDVLVSILYSKQRFIGFEEKKKHSADLLLEIRKAEEVWIALNVCQAKFNETMSIISVSTNSDSYIHSLESSVSFIGNFFNNTKSPILNYYLNFLLVDLQQSRKNYSLAEEYLLQMIQVIERNKSVFSEFRLGSALLNNANNLLYLKKLDQSLSFIDKAKKYFKDYPLQLSILSSIEFYGHFYTNEIENALENLQLMVRLSTSSPSKFIMSQINYFMACLHFLKGDIKKSLDQLGNTEEVDEDKEGWNIIKRIMIILCRIELNDSESTDLKISNMDRFIKRVIKSKHIKPRYIIISRILRKLVNENFNYVKVYQSRIKYFKLLEGNEAGYCWEIKSPELIIFEEWFRFKMKKVAYDNKEAMARKFHLAG